MPNDLSDPPTQTESPIHVSTGALVKRLNRVLSKEGEAIKVSRSPRAKFELGQFYIRNSELNSISGTHVDLEGLARDLGVLADDEEWVDQEEMSQEVTL